MNEMNKKKKIILIISISVLIAITIASSTIAYFGWIAEEESTIDVTVIGGTGSCSFKSDNNIELEPVSARDSGRIIKFKAVQQLGQTAPIAWNMIVKSIGGLKHETFRYEMINTTTGVSYGSGNFADISNNDSIYFSNDTELLEFNKEYEFTLYLWIDGTIGNNPLSMAGQNIDFSMNCVMGDGVVPGTNLIEHITNLYNNASKSTVTNNGITYNYATSVSLMNDRLGNSNIGINDGNIRYYGASPNNYIDIGDVYEEDTIIDNFEKNKVFLNTLGISNSENCYLYFDCSTNLRDIGGIMGLEFTDEASCTVGLQNNYHISSVDDMCGTSQKKAGDPKLYRIIGLFKNIELESGTTQDLIKVIREDSIGNLAWDLKGTSESDDTSYNNWYDSTLQTILNGAYYNSTSTTHSYFDFVNNAFIYGSDIDFRKNGLNSDAHDKIATVKWNLGGWNSTSIYANDIYGYERGEAKCTDCTYETKWPGKVALMYPSDFGYATDLSSCSRELEDYTYSSDCYTKDWLFSLTNGSGMEWLLTPETFSSARTTYVSYGYVRGGDVSEWKGVRPVFYLNSELSIESGDGSEGTPFVIQ